MNEILSRLINLRNLALLGFAIFTIGVIQALIYGYAEWVNPNLLFFEEPMDKMTFGLILFGTSFVASIFSRQHKVTRFKLAVFALVFTIFSRLLWEVLWVTGSYYPSIYISASILNRSLPVFAWEGDSKLDYITDAFNHFTFQYSLFAISLAALILVLLSILIDARKKL